MKLSNTVALITGGAGSFGQHFAEAILLGGGSVFLTDIQESALEQAVSDITSKVQEKDVASGVDITARIGFAVQDVTEANSFETVFDAAEDKFTQVNVLVNNAGTCGQLNFYSDKTDAWQKILDINLTAVITGSKVAIRRMSSNEKKEGEAMRGLIINVASGAGLYAAPFMPVYGASKAGVVSLTRSLGFMAAGEQAILVSSLCPFFADNRMGQLATDHPMMQMGLKKLGGFIPMESITKAFLTLIEENQEGGATLQVSTAGSSYFPFKPLA